MAGGQGAVVEETEAKPGIGHRVVPGGTHHRVGVVDPPFDHCLGRSQTAAGRSCGDLEATPGKRCLVPGQSAAGGAFLLEPVQVGRIVNPLEFRAGGQPRFDLGQPGSHAGEIKQILDPPF